MEVPITSDDVVDSSLFLWGLLLYPVAVALLLMILDATVLKHAAARKYQRLLADVASWVTDRTSLAGQVGMSLVALTALAFLLLSAYGAAIVYGSAMASIVVLGLVGIGELAALVFGDFTVSETIAYVVIGLSAAWALLVAALMVSLTCLES